jgi:hypothetical protein
MTNEEQWSFRLVMNIFSLLVPVTRMLTSLMPRTYHEKPQVPPNLVQRDRPMVRVFSLVDGTWVGDFEAEKVNTASVTYDAHKNVIWAYDREMDLIKQWCNTSPSPLTSVVAAASSSSQTDATAATLVSSLLAECHRFVTFHLTGLDEPVRVLSGVLDFETMCVQPNAHTFELFARLMRPTDIAPTVHFLVTFRMLISRYALV